MKSLVYFLIYCYIAFDQDNIGLFVMGDFNCPYFTSTISYLNQCGMFVNCCNGGKDIIHATFPTQWPISELDHIFLHTNSKLNLKIDQEYECSHTTKLEQIASDHHPICTQFVVR